MSKGNDKIFIGQVFLQVGAVTSFGEMRNNLVACLKAAKQMCLDVSFGSRFGTKQL